jgi:hypothetical protein
MTKTPSLKLLAAIQLALGTVISLLGFWIGGLQLGASIAIGSGLMLFNLIGLGWSWQRLMIDPKKSIAWTLVIIVIKYAVLLGSIFVLAREPWFSSLGAGLGISSFVLAALIMALIFRKDIA